MAVPKGTKRKPRATAPPPVPAAEPQAEKEAEASPSPEPTVAETPKVSVTLTEYIALKSVEESKTLLVMFEHYLRKRNMAPLRNYVSAFDEALRKFKDLPANYL